MSLNTALCEDLPNPVSGSVSLTGNSVGDTATYSCILGFNLVGTITRTCEIVSPSTAEWSSEAPVCERKSTEILTWEILVLEHLLNLSFYYWTCILTMLCQ